MRIYIQRHAHPDRTEVRDSRDTWLATFTDGAYTVTSAGPGRTFTEATAAHPVSHAIWVRTLPALFDGHADSTWLTRALAANRKAAPDVLAIAMQFIAGSHDAIPRRAFEILAAAPGVLVVPNAGVQVKDFSRIGSRFLTEPDCSPGHFARSGVFEQAAAFAAGRTHCLLGRDVARGLTETASGTSSRTRPPPDHSAAAPTTTPVSPAT